MDNRLRVAFEAAMRIEELLASAAPASLPFDEDAAIVARYVIALPERQSNIDSMIDALKHFVRAFTEAREKYAKRYGSNQLIGYRNFDAMPDSWPMEGLQFDMGAFRRADTALAKATGDDNA